MCMEANSVPYDTLSAKALEPDEGPGSGSKRYKLKLIMENLYRLIGNLLDFQTNLCHCGQLCY